MAARLEQEAEPMQILTCAATAGLIGDDFRFGELELEGFGTRRIMVLEAERAG